MFPVQELTLQGLVSGVEVTVVDAESLKVEDRIVHKCTFPVRELLGTHTHIHTHTHTHKVKLKHLFYFTISTFKVFLCQCVHQKGG